MRDETRLLHIEPDGAPFRALTTPVHRGSTIIFETVEGFLSRHDRFYDGYSYGLYGHPASRSLAQHVAMIEGGSHCLIVPSGMAAISLVNLALLKAGDHVLLPEAAYGPAREAAVRFLSGLGVRAGFYDPLCGSGIKQVLLPETKLVWVESPGSFTMEVQDLPAIAGAVHDQGALVAADCTWASPLGFKALGHGADITIQALSKHVGGHSDLLLGAVTVASEPLFRSLKDVTRHLGLGVSPDDCFLALRGLGTLSARLERQTGAALGIASALRSHPEIRRVLYPPLPDDPGHAIWSRDFTGASGVFSIVLRQRGEAELAAFIEGLRLFQIGASWGGLHSLIAPVRRGSSAAIDTCLKNGPLLRLSIGLEHPEDLLADLLEGLTRYGASAQVAAE